MPINRWICLPRHCRRRNPFSIPYQRNDTVPHRCIPFPKRKNACFLELYIPAEEGRPVALTYNLNRLRTLFSEPICITLNEIRNLD